jgi:hypothetical protein
MVIINYRKCKFCLFMSIDIVSLIFHKILGTSQYWVCLGKIRPNDLFPLVQALGCINPLKAELSPICHLLALLELTIFSTLAG